MNCENHNNQKTDLVSNLGCNAPVIDSISIYHLQCHLHNPAAADRFKSQRPFNLLRDA